MKPRKLFALFLSLTFLVGTLGLARAAEEKKIAKPPMQNAEGVVKSVSDVSIVIEGKDKKERTFAISGKVAESTKKLKPGDTVKVSFTEDGGKMAATRIQDLMRKKAANPCAAKGASKAPAGANPCAAKK